MDGRNLARMLRPVLPPDQTKRVAGIFIPPESIYRLSELHTLLGVKPTTLRREAREGRLRVARRGGWLWTTGAWIHEWLAAGEVKRHTRNGRG